MTNMPPAVPPSGGSYTPPPPPPPGGGYTAPPSGPAGSDRTLMLVLSYLGILALIPLIMKKDDRDVQWHAKNGLMLTVAFIVISILWSILNNFMPASIGCALSFVGCAIWIGWLALSIMGIMKALKGERFRIPVVSDMADKM
jgi:uncharacterized membrane protein